MQLYLKWAVFVTAAVIVIRLIMFVAGISLDPSMAWVQWVGTAISVGLIFMGVRERKLEDPSSFTFGRGWVTTFMICLMAGVLVGIWIFVDASYIETDMIDMARKAQEAAMAAAKMPADQVATAMKVSSFFISPSGFALTTVFAYIFGGAFLGLIISPIVKATGNNSIPESEMPTSDPM